jgi:Ca-activated chloride channel family protein
MFRQRRAALVFVFLQGASLFLLTAPFVTAQTKLKTRITTRTDLVQLSVVVFDASGRLATDLHKGDFRILEDGAAQRIVSCERERIPVSFVILADLSSSMTNKIPFVQQAALALVEPTDSGDEFPDEYSLLGIATHATSLMPFNGDQADLERRIPWLIPPTNGSTALFDGIYLGVRTALREAANRHRALIVISDGGDNHSRYNLPDVKQFLEEADMPVFAVMAGPSFELPTLLTRQKRSSTPGRKGPGQQVANLPIFDGLDDYIGPAERRGPSNLKTIAEVSGGGVFTAKTPEDLPRIVRTIGQAIRHQYLLTYEPDHKQKRAEACTDDNCWHKIELELYPKDKFKKYSLPYYKHGYRSID